MTSLPPEAANGLAWWRTQLTDLQEREASARRAARAARLELAAVRVQLTRAEALAEARERDGEALRHELAAQAKVATGRERQVRSLEEQVRDLKAERRVLTNRADRLGRSLKSLQDSRTYKLMRFVWRVRRALVPSFIRRDDSHT